MQQKILKIGIDEVARRSGVARHVVTKLLRGEPVDERLRDKVATALGPSTEPDTDPPSKAERLSAYQTRWGRRAWS